MEKNAVVTFIPKVFYLGPKTRTAIQNQTESLSLVNMKWTIQSERAKQTTSQIHLALNKSDVLKYSALPHQNKLEHILENSFLYRKFRTMAISFFLAFSGKS